MAEEKKIELPVPVVELEERKSFVDYLNIFLKRKEIIFTFFIISVGLSAIYYYRLPNIYKATVQLLIGREVALVTSPEVAAATVPAARMRGRYPVGYFETQFYILKSSPILKTLVEQLELTKKYEYFATGDPVKKIRDMIEVKRIKPSSVVNLSVKFTDAKLCAQIANLLAELYIKQSIATKLYFSEEVLKWFPEEAEKIKMRTIYGQLQELSKKEIIESLPSVAQDPVLRKLKSRKAELEAELKSQVSHYKDKHPIIKKLRSDLKYVEDRIQIETKKIVDNLRAELAGKLQLSNIRIIQYATVPAEPIGPNRLKGIMIAGGIGLLMGCGLVYLLDYLDNTIKSQEDVEKYIKLPYLGHIPTIKVRSKSSAEKRIFVRTEPDSAITEAFRNIRTGVVFSAPSEVLKTILVTSTVPSEGKSLVAVNLVTTIAMDGNKVLLVDADMRKPSLHTTFNLENSVGLSNYLTGSEALDVVINNTFVENLYFVSGGPIPPNPSGILGSFRMEEFIKEAKAKFDRIIIDAPPLIGVSDSIILSKMVDGTLITIRFGTASRDIIIKAKQFLTDVGSNILGVILNDVDVERESYYSRYYHYYSRYYAKYGEEKPSTQEESHQV